GDGFGFGLVLFFDAAAPAGGLARAVAGSSQNAGEDVRVPVHHVRVGVAAGGDEADVFGNGGVGGARPLAVDDLVEVALVFDVRRLQRGSYDRKVVSCSTQSLLL